ncbi:hypothetical protein EIP86_000534 [Pleurotus ostreatoroseus]|nr:hypothetical protein EIP86_000534 [Pleurotus ostreatoroseus]
MSWANELLQVSGPSLAYIVLGGFVVMFSMMSLLVKEKVTSQRETALHRLTVRGFQIYANEVVLGTAVGIIMGPHCANVFNPRYWGEHSNVITLEVMRIVLATGLFAIGVELPSAYLAHHAKGLLFMIVPTMAFGWIIVAGLIVAIFPNLTFISALVIAACLTPTDPIICAAIVGGKFAHRHVPESLRHIIAAESAANDGLAYPFLTISIYLTIESSAKVAVGKWLLIGCLYQVVLGTVIGALIGLSFCKLMKQAHRLGFIDQESYVAQYLALAIFTIGVVSTIGSDDLLAAFAAGSAIAWDGDFKACTEDVLFSSVIDLILNCGCFVYIGAWMPFTAFNSPELGITLGRLFALMFAVLMGVGAVFVSTLALSRLPTPQNPPQKQAEYLAATLQVIVSFVVLGSIFIHGLSIPFFSAGRRLKSRTLSASRTWTARHSIGHAPDWLLNIKRLPASTSNPGLSHDSQTHVDVEQGLYKESKISSEPEIIIPKCDNETPLQTGDMLTIQMNRQHTISNQTSLETLAPLPRSLLKPERYSPPSHLLRVTDIQAE